jgi:hypothetical protein
MSFGSPSPLHSTSPVFTTSRLSPTPAPRYPASASASTSPTHGTAFCRSYERLNLENELISLLNITDYDSVEPIPQPAYYYSFGTAASASNKALCFVSVAHVGKPPGGGQCMTRLLVKTDDDPLAMASSFTQTFVGATSNSSGSSVQESLVQHLSRIKQTCLLFKHKLYPSPNDSTAALNDRLVAILRSHPMVLPAPPNTPQYKVLIKVAKSMYSRRSRVDLRVNVKTLLPFHLYVFCAATLKVTTLTKLKIYLHNADGTKQALRIGDGRIKFTEECYYEPMVFTVGCGYNGNTKWISTPTKTTSATTPRTPRTPATPPLSQQQPAKPRTASASKPPRLKLSSWDFSLPGEARRTSIENHDDLNEFVSKQFDTFGSFTSLGSDKNKSRNGSVDKSVDAEKIMEGTGCTKSVARQASHLSVDDGDDNSDESDESDNAEPRPTEEKSAVEIDASVNTASEAAAPAEVDEPPPSRELVSEMMREHLTSGHLSVDDGDDDEDEFPEDFVAAFPDEPPEAFVAAFPDHVEASALPPPDTSSQSRLDFSQAYFDEPVKSGHLSVDDQSSSSDGDESPTPSPPPAFAPTHTPLREQVTSGHLSVDDSSLSSSPSTTTSSSSSSSSQVLPPPGPAPQPAPAQTLYPAPAPAPAPVESFAAQVDTAARPTTKSGHLSVDDSDSESAAERSSVSVDSNISLSSASDSSTASDTAAAAAAAATPPVEIPAAVAFPASETAATTTSAIAQSALELAAVYLCLPSLYALSRVNKALNHTFATALPAVVRNNGVAPAARARYWRRCTALPKEANYWELVRESTSAYKKMQKAGTTPKKLGWVSVIEMDVQRTYAAAHGGVNVETEEAPQPHEEELEDEGWGSFVSHKSFDENEKGQEDPGDDDGDDDEWGDFEGHDDNDVSTASAALNQTEEERHKAWEKDTSLRENEEAVTSLLEVLQVNLSIAEHHKYSKRQLRRILWAFSTLNPEVGYVQGMNMVVRLLLEVTEGDEESCFHILCGLVAIDRFGMAEMWKDGFQQLERCADKLEELLQAELPALCEHLDKFGIKPAFYSTKWFLTLYSCYGVVGLDVLHVVWDIFLTEGWGVMFGVAVGVLTVLEAQILGETEIDGVMEILQNVGSEMMWADQGWGAVLDETIRRWAAKDVWGVDRKVEAVKEEAVNVGNEEEEEEEEEEEWDWRSGDC